MIRIAEILRKSEVWQVPPNTVDKDYVLGHLLSLFLADFSEKLSFKGGTCLKKCYLPDYRFSEDLDFTALSAEFQLNQEELEPICEKLHSKTAILLHCSDVLPMMHKDVPKGYQVYIKYWGANHRRDQQPPPAERWNTSIKIEISTDEIILLPVHRLEILHPYSDTLSGIYRAPCYDLREIVAEKLRSLVQRSYTAPRDYFDIYHLTKEYSGAQWDEVKGFFLRKMEFKKIKFEGPGQLVNDEAIANVRKAWRPSLDHQRYQSMDMEEIIGYVREKIHSIF